MVARRIALLGFLSISGAEPVCAEFVCAGFEPAPPNHSVVAAKVSADPVGQNGVHALVVFAKFLDEAPRVNQAPTFATDLFNPGQPGSLATHKNDRGRLSFLSVQPESHPG